MIEVDSGHPNAGADGHNLQSSDLHCAWEEVQKMLREGFLYRVPEDMLAATEDHFEHSAKSLLNVVFHNYAFLNFMESPSCQEKW